MNRDLLIVFLRAPERGRVKTRLAATVGEDRALAVYEQLLAHTLREAAPLPCMKEAWYADAVPDKDPSADHGFMAHVQQGTDLGARMAHAFERAFASGDMRAVIIGTDCPGINSGLLREAFEALAEHDAVIGPARDGGYYLLGLRSMVDELFANKAWSSDSVLKDSLADLQRRGASYRLLPELIDVDTEADLDAIDRTT